MRLGRAICACAAALTLWLAPSASAANQLLETINVDPANTAATSGTVELKTGIKYELHVSGTFTLANGSGQSFDEDALYCFGDSGFDSPQCTTSGSPGPQRFGDFYIGSGSSSLKNIDAYQEPGGGGTQLGYSISHTYIVDFYPPAAGTLTAGGVLAYSHCKAPPNPCTTTLTGGPITIQIYGPPPSSPPYSFAALRPPPAFCFAHASNDITHAAPAEFDCESREYLRNGTKFEARDQLRLDLRLTLEVCGIAFGIINRAQHVPGNKEEAETDLDWAPMCELLMRLTVASLAVVKDPPNPHLRSLQMLIPAAHVTSRSPRCPQRFSAHACIALLKARSSYLNAVAAVSRVEDLMAQSANRFAADRQANNVALAFLEEAASKVYAGIVVSRLRAAAAAGRGFAGQLKADGMGLTATARTVRTLDAKVAGSAITNPVLDQLVHDGTAPNRPAARSLITSNLSGLSGSIDLASALGAPFSTTGFEAQYRSITIRELNGLVGLARANNQVSAAGTQRLSQELANAQANCGHANARIALIKQFRRDVSKLVSNANAPGAIGAAAFLQIGAQPLTAVNVPASSCKGASSLPTFTGNWNTSFGPMQLTQTGNQVTGTYADCPNSGATISGQVTGSALDGTWTEPCHNAQGRIHFVLSSDGNSFTGLWAVGSNNPSAAWNGTRAP